MPKISGRSGAAASYDKKGKEFIFPHEDPKRIDARRTLRGIKNPESVEEIAKNKKKMKARKAVKQIAKKVSTKTKATKSKATPKRSGTRAKRK